jgi:hypothetical protein
VLTSTIKGDNQNVVKDSDDENEFEGFGPEDLIPDYEILREIDLQQSLKDRNVQPYDKFGWLPYESNPYQLQEKGTPSFHQQ